jgi:CBS domain-containing protein
MTEPVFVGPLHYAADTLLLHDRPMMAVVEGGLLVGVVRRSVLESAPPDTTVSELMEPPVSIPWDQALAEVIEEMDGLSMGPVPVTDPEGRLVGTLATPIDVTE